MNDTEYLKQMITLSEELERAASARPYDPDAYNDVVDRLNRLFTSKGQRRRRRPWLMILLIILLAVFCGLIVVHILSVIII